MTESPTNVASPLASQEGSIKLSEDGWGEGEDFNKTTDLKAIREVAADLVKNEAMEDA